MDLPNSSMPGVTDSTRALAQFLAAIRFEEVPPAVVARTEELFLDWFASALAGKDARPTRIMEQFAAEMGPREGASEILVSRKRTSPVFAALINGAASHFVEQELRPEADFLQLAGDRFRVAGRIFERCPGVIGVADDERHPRQRVQRRL